MTSDNIDNWVIPAYESKSKNGECKNEGSLNKISQLVHSAYCDECLAKNKPQDRPQTA